MGFSVTQNQFHSTLHCSRNHPVRRFLGAFFYSFSFSTRQKSDHIYLRTSFPLWILCLLFVRILSTCLSITNWSFIFFFNSPHGRFILEISFTLRNPFSAHPFKEYIFNLSWLHAFCCIYYIKITIGTHLFCQPIQISQYSNLYQNSCKQPLYGETCRLALLTLSRQSIVNKLWISSSKRVE